jgi:hypothetical protein
MVRLASLLLALSLVACRAPETLKYPHTSPEDTAQAWANAFNHDEIGQMRLLVHPDRRDLFEGHEIDVRKQLAAFDIQKWAVGEEVVVNDSLKGRAVTFWFHDGAKVVQNPAVLVFAEGHWWVWRY